MCASTFSISRKQPPFKLLTVSTVSTFFIKTALNLFKFDRNKESKGKVAEINGQCLPGCVPHKHAFHPQSMMYKKK